MEKIITMLLIASALILATSSTPSLAIPKNLDQLQDRSSSSLTDESASNIGASSSSPIGSANGSVKLDLVPTRRGSTSSKKSDRGPRCGRGKKKRCKKSETCQRTCKSKCVLLPKAGSEVTTMDSDCYKVHKFSDGQQYDFKTGNKNNNRTKGIGSTCTRDRECCRMHEGPDQISSVYQCCANGCRPLTPLNDATVQCDKNLDPCRMVTDNGVDLATMNMDENRYLAPGDSCDLVEDDRHCCYAVSATNPAGYMNHTCQEGTCRPITPIGT